MKKLLGILVLGLLLSGNAVAANYFKYNKIIACGPKKISYASDVSSYEQWKYYYIHIDANGHFIIFNDGFQYSSLEKKNYSQLYIQNHKITSAILKKDEITDVYNFEMNIEYNKDHPTDHKNRIIFFNLNLESMTFSKRTVGYSPKKKYEPSTGICWYILK